MVLEKGRLKPYTVWGKWFGIAGLLTLRIGQLLQQFTYTGVDVLQGRFSGESVVALCCTSVLVLVYHMINTFHLLDVCFAVWVPYCGCIFKERVNQVLISLVLAS